MELTRSDIEGVFPCGIEEREAICKLGNLIWRRRWKNDFDVEIVSVIGTMW